MTKVNKPLIFLGVMLLALSPFIVFCYRLDIGILLFITGIVSIKSIKKENKKPLIILTIITMSILILSLLINLLLSMGIKIYGAVEGNLSYFNLNYLLEEYVQVFKNMFQLFIYTPGSITSLDVISEINNRYINNIEFYLSQYTIIQYFSVPLTILLILVSFVLLLNIFIKKNILKKVLSIIIAITLLIVFMVSLSNLFSIITNIFIYESFVGLGSPLINLKTMLDALIEEGNVLIWIPFLYSRFFYKFLYVLAILTTTFSFVLFVLTCISTTKLKKNL